MSKQWQLDVRIYIQCVYIVCDLDLCNAYYESKKKNFFLNGNLMDNMKEIQRDKQMWTLFIKQKPTFKRSQDDD